MYLETVGIVEMPAEPTAGEWGAYFHINPHHGKDHAVMTRELLEVAGETRKRRVNGCDTDDQWWRVYFLGEAPRPAELNLGLVLELWSGRRGGRCGDMTVPSELLRGRERFRGHGRSCYFQSQS